MDDVECIGAEISECAHLRQAPMACVSTQPDAARLHQAIVDAMPAGVGLLDHEGRLLVTNAVWRRLFDEAGGDLPNYGIGGAYVAICGRSSCTCPDECKEIKNDIRALLCGGATGPAKVYRCEAAGQPRWFQVNLVSLEAESVQVAVVHTDITERVLAEQQLAQMAHFDSLTGLPNRVLFQNRLHSALQLSRRYGHVVAVLFVDLDRFKLINDTFGHIAGDALLNEVAARLSGQLRESDTMARLGGDEFAVIVPQAKDFHDVVIVARKLIESLSRPIHIEGQEVFVTASIGIALQTQHTDDPDTLLRNADSAMYRAKALGRNNYQFFTAELGKSSAGQLKVETELRRALQRNEFILRYQPKVSCVTGQIIGVEALLRWQHPERGLVSPQDFVPLLEETGLIVQVGNWALKTACTQIQAWHASGLARLSVAVNLSARQLYAPGVEDVIRQALLESGLDASFLEIEITESMLMQNVQQAIDTLFRLKSMGVRLSVDDFGTGYSSLSYLKRFPLDSVKVDRSFVQDITADADDASITRAVITMAHNLQLKVVAEGVETKGQLGMLISNKCDVIQGYYFSKPVSPEEIEDMVRQGRRLESDMIGAPRQRTLLLVDDEDNVLSALKRLLRRDGYRILVANSGCEGLEILAQEQIDVIVSDQRMPGMNGVQFLRRAKNLHPHTIRIVLSGYTELQSITDAINEGSIYKFLTKPWDDANLRANIEEAFRRKEIVDENQRLHLEVQHGNRELSRVNHQLRSLLEEKKQRIERGETSLSVTQEVLQHLPWPILGVADDGMIALANTPATSMLQADQPLVGAFATDVLPRSMLALLAESGDEWSLVDVQGKRYRTRCQIMGSASRCRGKLLLLMPNQDLHG